MDGWCTYGFKFLFFFFKYCQLQSEHVNLQETPTSILHGCMHVNLTLSV